LPTKSIYVFFGATTIDHVFEDIGMTIVHHNSIEATIMSFQPKFVVGLDRVRTFIQSSAEKYAKDDDFAGTRKLFRTL